MGAVLSKIPCLKALFADSPTELIRTPVKNVAGKTVGEIRPAAAFQQMITGRLG
jgi:hypothetical protein